MPFSQRRSQLEILENRRLFAWSSYAQLVDQDVAAGAYSGITGEGVTVAVIDTGIDYSHAALGGGFGSGKKVIGGYDFYDNDSDPMDESGHGTMVAGVIAANPYTTSGVTYQGVAPDAKLVALRVGTESSISNDNIERALQWIITHHDTYDISVVNLSLGSGNYIDPETDSQMSDEFASLRELGIFVVAASGNSNDASSGPIDQDGVAYPSADPNVFAVAAVDAGDVITTWAQRGDELDLLAPGVDIVMPKMGGGYETEDGTSFASPYVAGAAALIQQAWSGALPGDVGSILMTSGTGNLDGDNESGDTTGLLFSRLDIDNALALTAQRKTKYDSLNFGNIFATALDSQGVLHAAYYDDVNGDLLYATRGINGKWSGAYKLDYRGDVGAQLTIAVDGTGKIGIGYFDVTNTAIKYIGYNGTSWRSAVVDSDKHVGTDPSIGFDVNGNAYLAYYKRSGGDLKLATLDRQTGKWTRQTVDGLDGSDVGVDLSLDIGEARLRSGFFTQYDTTVAIAYADSTNGNLKYWRHDLDSTDANAMITEVVDDNSGVSSIDLDLHEGPLQAGLQAQIAYKQVNTADVKYAYKYQTWFTETVATTGKLGDTVQMYFNADDDPIITYFDRDKRSLFSATRVSSTTWTKAKVASSAGPMAIALNDRTGETIFSYLNRPRTDVFSAKLI